jgi:nitroreductase
MISRESIQNVIEAGARAPSGSNSQPWRFEVSGEAVSIFMMPEKDHPILNVKNRGTMLANGAVIKNMLVAADHFGLKSSLAIFPDSSDKNLIATIAFSQDGMNEPNVESDALFEAISKRATNRKPYDEKLLSDGEKKNILDTLGRDVPSYIVLKFTDDRAHIERLAAAASKNEIVLFEDKRLHELFFKEIVWTEREEKEKKEGLFLATMELPPPAAAALRVFKFWPLMNMVNRLGFARKIATDNATGYARCSWYGAVICSDSDEGFVKAGMAIEGVWLAATALGLSFHLQTGVNFLWQRSDAEGKEFFSGEHEAIIRKAYDDMVEVFGAEEGSVPAIFRIGFAGEPSARSSKKAPKITFH